VDGDKDGDEDGNGDDQGNQKDKKEKEERDFDDRERELEKESEAKKRSPQAMEAFEKAVQFFDNQTTEPKVNLLNSPKKLYAGKKEVVEEPMTKVTLSFIPCPGCESRHGHHNETCARKQAHDPEVSYHRTIRVEETKSGVAEQQKAIRQELNDVFETHFAKPVVSHEDASAKSNAENEEEPRDVGSTVTVNKKELTSVSTDKHNVSNISVSSGDDVEHEKQRFSSDDSPPKFTYVTEIKVLPTNLAGNGAEEEEQEEVEVSSDNEEVASIMDSGKSASSSAEMRLCSNGKLPVGRKPPVPPRRSDATRFLPRSEAVLPERQVVYVSEFKSPARDERGGESRKFDNWIFLKENVKDKQQETNPWSNGSSPSQPVTSIMLSTSLDEKIARE
jgi:hypothetical protein